ncbi:hypothetical protein [Pseudomonas sp.]
MACEFIGQSIKQEEPPMDDYQEELLESRAFDQDDAEPVEDATEI